MFCRGCGAPLQEGAHFCTKCGRVCASAPPRIRVPQTQPYAVVRRLSAAQRGYLIASCVLFFLVGLTASISFIHRLVAGGYAPGYVTANAAIGVLLCFLYGAYAIMLLLRGVLDRSCAGIGIAGLLMNVVGLAFCIISALAGYGVFRQMVLYVALTMATITLCYAQVTDRPALQTVNVLVLSSFVVLGMALIVSVLVPISQYPGFVWASRFRVLLTAIAMTCMVWAVYRRLRERVRRQMDEEA